MNGDFEVSTNTEFTVEEATHIRGAKIKIIGCGGGGGNMINHMIKSGLEYQNLDFIAANTDGQALSKSLAKTKIQLGEQRTKGLGAGGDPVVGAESANENFDELKAYFKETDIVFISAGLGGGTGTGSAPIVARAAKEAGALTVAVVTMPFRLEGKKKRSIAEKGLCELKKESDSILVIQNEKVNALSDKKAGFLTTYALVDDVLVRAVKGMVSMLLENSRVNVDFADVKAIMQYRGLALMGMGEAQGAEAATQALENALHCPLLDDLEVKDAKGVLVHLKIHPEFAFGDLNEALTDLQDDLDDEVNFKYGICDDENMPVDKIEITIIATGFEKDESAGNGGFSGNGFGGGNDGFSWARKTGTDDLDSPTITRGVSFPNAKSLFDNKGQPAFDNKVDLSEPSFKRMQQD